MTSHQLQKRPFASDSSYTAKYRTVRFHHYNLYQNSDTVKDKNTATSELPVRKMHAINKIYRQRKEHQESKNKEIRWMQPGQ